MGRRGRLGGLAGRRDRASDRRRELADLTYDGSAPSACALLQQASALQTLPFSNGLDPRRSKQTGPRRPPENLNFDLTAVGSCEEPTAYGVCAPARRRIGIREKKVEKKSIQKRRAKPLKDTYRSPCPTRDGTDARRREPRPVTRTGTATHTRRHRDSLSVRRDATHTPVNAIDYAHT